MNDLKKMTNRDLLELFDTMDVYDLPLCIEITSRAGLADEWDTCTGETFESVLDAAISILRGCPFGLH